MSTGNVIVPAASTLIESGIEVKSASYTTTESDFNKTLRFTAGVAAMGAIGATYIGQFFMIRNATGADMTVLADTGVTINGETKIRNNQSLALHVVGVNEYDAIGGYA